jgi:GntR family transcriptional repressor for pyruvate dehydrogenase complex
MKKPVTIALALAPLPNRTAELARRLSAEIESGRFPPGSQLPTEQQLAATTGVSRTVVREAVAALRAEGLVVTQQGRGAFVATDARRRPFRIDPDEMSSVTEVLRVLELRMSLETEAAGLAADRRTAKDLAAIERALAAVDTEIAAGGSAVEADFRFHLAIFRSVDNPHFPRFLDFLGSFIIPRQIVHVESESEAERRQYLARIQSEHIAIFEAIRDRDVERARAAARAHLTHSRTRYQELAARIARRERAKANRATAAEQT